MHSTHIGELPFPNLPAAARTVHLFPKMGRALLAIPLLCDHGCQAIFEADWFLVKIKATGRTILTGRRDKETRLWLVDLEKSAPTVAQPITLKANSSLARETIPERLAFLHVALGYPVPATFENAIEQGHYTTIPELTSARVQFF